MSDAEWAITEATLPEPAWQQGKGRPPGEAPSLQLKIVWRPDDLHTFQVLPRRWVVERTLAWITRCRRTVRDYERLPSPFDVPSSDHPTPFDGPL